MNKTKVIIADDNTVFLEGLGVLFSKQSWLEIINTYSDGLELLNSKKLGSANLLLVDIDMPKLNGVEAAAEINKNYPNLPMIAMTMHNEKVYIEEIILAGFKGFIHKPEIYNLLFSTIEQVLEGNYVFPDDLTEKYQSHG